MKIKSIWHRIFPSKTKSEFSIGIYTGSSPLSMKPIKENPVLTKEDVTDCNAAYVADPFIIKVKDLWYMLFEIRVADSYETKLAYATSTDCINWEYKKIIPTDFFRSYPHVFEYDGEYYMTPEKFSTKSVIVYRARVFPESWEKCSVVSEGRDYVDPTIFRQDNNWWAFASNTDNSELYLFYANSLEGPWTEHYLSPVIKGDKSSSRPAGRVIRYNGDLYRFAQDCSNYYGEKVLAFKILRLTPMEYDEEKAGTILDKGGEWNGKGMHTFDAHEISEGNWIAAVDGYKEVS